ncbi:deoxyribonuclease II [Calliopsis andreniformis]|uniref:deoxyribonuclease II n=1 Tax=Calliopsis andreniformis TaxID=337506 RepID=UPI003FCCF132
MRVSFYVVIFLIACNAVNSNFYGKLQCKDENNAPVDWFVIYKLPKDPITSNPQIREGVGYLYITDKTVENGWKLSTRSIDSNSSMPGITLAPLYDDETRNENLWALYNDSPANKTTASSTYGHTKGAIAVNRDQGFWLIHSVPHFPPIPSNESNIKSGYSYPKNAKVNGQSFLCISIGSDQFNTFGKQLMYNEIIVYAKNAPEEISKQYPMLRNATNQIRIKKAPYTNKAVIKSLGSQEFTSFAKGSKWGKELYIDLVAPQLQSDLYVQTWLRSSDKIPSTCRGKNVYNIETIIFGIIDVTYKSTRDHSKWAISTTNRKTSWVCVADINRATTQSFRGGGAVCIDHPQLWTAYRNIINYVEQC